LLFNTYEFIFIFVPVTFVTYFYLNKIQLIEVGKGWLVFSSLFFYSWWNVAYLPLILSSIIFNYVFGNLLARRSSDDKRFFSRSILIFGVTCNLTLLGYFKYADFFIANINIMFGSQFELLHIVLPLAISFFTFQQIAYLVDSYHQDMQEHGFLNYAVFVSFFPQLIAGPIVHHKEMMPQFASIQSKVVSYKNISAGLYIFSIGLFKKVFVADTFAVWATNGFDVEKTLNLVEAWVTSLSYTFQLYFDFSGYCDMAIGLALLFNIKLPINFNSPYKAKDIQDFWKRWHMTLSRFLMDYVYIPLGGNRRGNSRTYNNLMITFFLGGLWHGAGWTFVFWGCLHGCALIIHRFWSLRGFKMWGWLGWLITFNFLNITWVFFRAKEWPDAIKVIRGMFNLESLYVPESVSRYPFNSYNVEIGSYMQGISPSGIAAPIIILSLLAVVFLKNSTEIQIKFKMNYLSSLIIGVVFGMFLSLPYIHKVLNIETTPLFLYFNF